MPEKCTAKVSKKSRIRCKAELWWTQRFGKESKQVPITTFNTKNLNLGLNGSSHGNLLSIILPNHTRGLLLQMEKRWQIFRIVPGGRN
jgi:hypothetical protein